MAAHSENRGARGGLRLAIVMWTGWLGGAETQMLALAGRLREMGHSPGFVFVKSVGHLEGPLGDMELPSVSLGMSRGSHVLLHPRRLRTATQAFGADGALLVSIGFTGVALRVAGYGSRLVAVEHGALGQLEYRSAPRRAVKLGERAFGALTTDVEVAVSDFMAEKARRVPHAKRLVRIHHGVDASVFKPLAGASNRTQRITIGSAGRLTEGKGLDALLRGFAGLPPELRGRLLIAGDGPLRPELEALSARLGIADSTEFVGWAQDVPRFWDGCDIAVVPSARTEAFGMAALEAMACGKPLIATRAGALPEVVGPDAGILLRSAEPEAITAALRRYSGDPSLRHAHASAARARALAKFDLGVCAERYAGLFTSPVDAIPCGFSRAEDL
jgi:glycosyltransferase involved in cell wall biosynthesis